MVPSTNWITILLFAEAETDVPLRPGDAALNCNYGWIEQLPFAFTGLLQLIGDGFPNGGKTEHHSFFKVVAPSIDGYVKD